MHNDLAEGLLNRVHTWMVKYYLVISPRPKIKVLRDFQGFEKIERIILDDDLADLEGDRCVENDSSCPQKKHAVYLFICFKNEDYIPGIGPAFVDCYEKEANNNIETICKSCGLEFDKFCMGLPNPKRIRQWKGHRQHCNTNNDNNL